MPFSPAATNLPVISAFEQCREDISPNGGLSFVARVLDTLPAMEKWDTAFPRAVQSRYGTGCIVRAMLGLLCVGHRSFAGITALGQDSLLKGLVGGAAPSEETLRQQIGALAAKDGWRAILDECVSQTLAATPPSRLSVGHMSLVPVDIDVSVLEDTSSHKEGVCMTYHRVNGYAPIFCYAGTQGYMVANELRPGSQHSENGAVEFLKRCIGILLASGLEAKDLLVRVDSGHDATDFVKALQDTGVKYIVKRNLRQKDRQQIYDNVRSGSDSAERPRSGKWVRRGFVADAPSGMSIDEYKGFNAVEATRRTILADGQALLFPQHEADCYWTNLPFGVGTIVALYHNHATSEQYHSELKSDMGLELLPCNAFKTNAFVLSLCAVAFNCLRLIGQKAVARAVLLDGWHRKVSRIRLREVLLDLVKVACKVVAHAGRTVLKFGRNCMVFPVLKEIYAAI